VLLLRPLLPPEFEETVVISVSALLSLQLSESVWLQFSFRYKEPSPSSTMSLFLVFLDELVKRTARPERPGCGSRAKDEA
jgi:hypothetical protein